MKHITRKCSHTHTHTHKNEPATGSKQAGLFKCILFQQERVCEQIATTTVGDYSDTLVMMTSFILGMKICRCPTLRFFFKT